ncbi:MAG: tRNA (adenosine(37)-N6)-dimethylallyltransferase MiaA [Candidatus Gastranaerophilales bacterium]|nr:tRNA (adenosine(37)-N6)-dimethylallyltransferase MiaA [Candidatus Gastranaerophilales bacterium]
MKKQKITAITGPSSSGKTSLAIKLAKELNGEIISVDSRQIYKELDIGTAKPSKEERQDIKHHLIDVIDITQEYTAAQFCDEAKNAVEEILKKGKMPILAGGTGLYYRILLQDFDLPRVAPDKELREELEKKQSSELYDMLLKLDYESAQKIHFNNKVKIIRALEVCIKLNMPMSKAQKKKNSEYDTLWIGLNSENRDFLYNIINKRVDVMFNNGLIKEAENLFLKYGCNNILMNTIGYQELYPYFNGEINIEEAASKIKQNTRRYAKRQISWFNANKNINWFDIEKLSTEDILRVVINMFEEKL